jgi:thioredoxin-related protein
MKKYFSMAILAACIVLSAFKIPLQGLSIGDSAPLSDVKMRDISGGDYSLSDLKEDNGLLVIFSCNTCPFVIGWEDQYPLLGQIAERNSIGMVLINSNEAKREGDDSLEEMKTHAQKMAYNSPYMVDEGSQLANAFGAKTTPHVYLFDKEMKLIYMGSINDKYENKSKEAEKFYLQDAIVNMMAGKTPNPAETKQIGCSIKRI